MVKPLPSPNPRDPQFQAGVRFAVAFLEELAARALADEPTNKGPVLCLKNAAEELERAAKRVKRAEVPTPARPSPSAPAGDLFADFLADQTVRLAAAFGVSAVGALSYAETEISGSPPPGAEATHQM